MNVKEIVKYWLEGNGYVGLYLECNGEEVCVCSLLLGDFMPLDNCPSENCQGVISTKIKMVKSGLGQTVIRKTWDLAARIWTIINLK